MKMIHGNFVSALRAHLFFKENHVFMEEKLSKLNKSLNKKGFQEMVLWVF
jgi:hypothetical protein